MSVAENATVAQRKCATWKEEEGLESIVLYPSMFWYEGVWEYCWFDDGEGDMEYTSQVLWWWHISEESKVAVTTQAISESQHEEQGAWLHL